MVGGELTDPAVAGENVLFSSHNDHDGVRPSLDGDSIMNGADDNASVSVGILAIGRAFARAPARRSALFVWHGAEEKGLLGSFWFVSHPTVPRDAIVAVLNADMIGRGPADTAALLGVHPPHRSSRAMAEMPLAANERYAGFVVDSSWDRPTHPENWYFRSDHLPRSYDLNRAAAEVWRRKASYYAGKFDFSTDNHSVKMSTVYQQCLKMADYYEARAGVSEVVTMIRSDVEC